MYLLSLDLKWINPQYHIHLKDPDSADYEDKCTVIISLMEKGQQAGNKIAIGYDIYKVTLRSFLHISFLNELMLSDWQNK